MNVAIVYVYPMSKLATYYPAAQRFAETWRRFPPGSEPYSLHVIGNGSPVPDQHRRLFDGIPGCTFLAWNNLGWDIGAFQYAAASIPCDLLICFGSHVHFHRPGWLDRMVQVFLEHGPALYGCWAYLSPNWHVRTTAFWMQPILLNSYPDQVGSSKKSRYTFEHGDKSFTRHILSAGLECLMVTWDGVFPFSQWHAHAPGVDNSLVLDQHTHR